MYMLLFVLLFFTQIACRKHYKNDSISVPDDISDSDSDCSCSENNSKNDYLSDFISDRENIFSTIYNLHLYFNKINRGTITN